jgi:diguanylate cyclase (GGDEF)-like protein
MQKNSDFKILIVDDEEVNVDLASIYLQDEGYSIKTAFNAEDALRIISKHKISLILLDINMPKVDGFRLCSMLKEENKTKDIPIIFLTAQNDINSITKAFEVGGSDYITKPFNILELKARVKVQLQNIAYLQEIKTKQSKLAQLTITDPLSKLYNGLYFDAQIKTKQQKNENFWIFYIKINNLEKINTLYGFYTVNKLLRIFAQILEKVSFKNSIVSRLFGANFAILTKAYSSEDMQKMYKELHKELKKNKSLNESIQISTVIFYVQDKKEPSLQNIYKKIQQNLATMQSNNKKVILIT